MTITLELTPEQEAKLLDCARARGVEPAEYLVGLIDQIQPAQQALLPGESLLDGLKRIGVIGAVAGGPTDMAAHPEKYMEGFGKP